MELSSARCSVRLRASGAEESGAQSKGICAHGLGKGLASVLSPDYVDGLDEFVSIEQDDTSGVRLANRSFPEACKACMDKMPPFTMRRALVCSLCG